MSEPGRRSSSRSPDGGRGEDAAAAFEPPPSPTWPLRLLANVASSLEAPRLLRSASAPCRAGGRRRRGASRQRSASDSRRPLRSHPRDVTREQLLAAKGTKAVTGAEERLQRRLLRLWRSGPAAAASSSASTSSDRTAVAPVDSPPATRAASPRQTRSKRALRSGGSSTMPLDAGAPSGQASEAYYAGKRVSIMRTVFEVSRQRWHQMRARSKKMGGILYRACKEAVRKKRQRGVLTASAVHHENGAATRERRTGASRRPPQNSAGPAVGTARTQLLGQKRSATPSTSSSTPKSRGLPTQRKSQSRNTAEARNRSRKYSASERAAWIRHLRRKVASSTSGNSSGNGVQPRAAKKRRVSKQASADTWSPPESIAAGSRPSPYVLRRAAARARERLGEISTTSSSSSSSASSGEEKRPPSPETLPGRCGLGVCNPRGRARRARSRGTDAQNAVAGSSRMSQERPPSPQPGPSNYQHHHEMAPGPSQLPYYHPMAPRFSQYRYQHPMPPRNTLQELVSSLGIGDSDDDPGYLSESSGELVNKSKPVQFPAEWKDALVEEPDMDMIILYLESSTVQTVPSTPQSADTPNQEQVPLQGGNIGAVVDQNVASPQQSDHETITQLPENRPVSVSDAPQSVEDNEKKHETVNGSNSQSQQQSVSTTISSNPPKSDKSRGKKSLVRRWHDEQIKGTSSSSDSDTEARRREIREQHQIALATEGRTMEEFVAMQRDLERFYGGLASSEAGPAEASGRRSPVAGPSGLQRRTAASRHGIRAAHLAASDMSREKKDEDSASTEPRPPFGTHEPGWSDTSSD